MTYSGITVSKFKCSFPYVFHIWNDQRDSTRPDPAVVELPHAVSIIRQGRSDVSDSSIAQFIYKR